MAKEEGCIIEGYLDGKDIIPETDLTIICLYPSLVLDFIKNNQFKPGSIVTDAVGIKSYFLKRSTFYHSRRCRIYFYSSNGR